MSTDRPEPIPPPTGPWRLYGWHPLQPGTGQWLAADGFRLTRRPENAATVSRYPAAEATAARLVADVHFGLPCWRPVPADVDDLDAYQTQTRPPRPAAVSAGATVLR